MGTTIYNNLPALSNEGGLSAYLDQIKKFPMLAAEEEYMLAKNWKTTGNIKAAEKLVTSHLRLVAKIAMGYKGYGLPVNEMISEGNVGLMQAVKKFEPEKGFRLATYAMWWIKASIQEYILRSWSLVKIGTTTAQKKLFFCNFLYIFLTQFGDTVVQLIIVKSFLKILSCGKTVKKSCGLGIKYVNSAIKSNPEYGKGHGPINQM